VAEVLAHHYRQTDHADKAFTYLSMAGSKSLSVYSLDEAANHFAAALTLLDKNPNCATDDQVAGFLAPYALLLNMTLRFNVMIELLEQYLQRIDRLDDDPRAVLIRHHFVVALLWNTRYREAALVQQATSPIAGRLGDSRAQAYSLAGEIHVSSMVAPKVINEFESLKQKAIRTSSDTTDAYIQSWTRFVIGWEEIHRGRVNEAREAARELMQVGQLLNDPRSTGFGLGLFTWIALVSESYTEALAFSQQSEAVAVTPFDRAFAITGKGCALVLLRRTDEGARLLEEQRRQAVTDGYLYALNGSDPAIGLCKVLQGNIASGIQWIEDAILRREQEGTKPDTLGRKLTYRLDCHGIFDSHQKKAPPAFADGAFEAFRSSPLS
jgi:hypothetical protein